MRVAEKYPNMKINFVGLFDPVGSIGWAGQFKPTVRATLSSKTQHAWQAIAMGENRQNFAATFIPGASYRWFPGNHGDVGGGWAEHRLSDECLLWMWGKATDPNIGNMPISNPNTLEPFHFDLTAPPVTHFSSGLIYTYTGFGRSRDTVLGRSNTIPDVIFRKAADFWNMSDGDHQVDIGEAGKNYPVPAIFRSLPSTSFSVSGIHVGGF